MDLFSLNIIICIVLIVICWVIWFFVEPDSLKISTRDVVALIATALIVLVSVLPFLTSETVKKTDYTSFPNHPTTLKQLQKRPSLLLQLQKELITL